MSKVEAVACDMNSDFEEAFREKCEHIDIVFDYFHIVKNFNEKVVAAVRKEEQPLGGTIVSTNNKPQTG